MLKISELTLSGLKECIVLSINNDLTNSISRNPLGVTMCIRIVVKDIVKNREYSSNYFGVVANPTGNCQA